MVSDQPKEKIEEVVINTISKMKIPDWILTSEMIDRCHRIGPADKENRPIIIKLVSYANRYKIWSNKKNCKDKGFYLTESLTKARIQLLKKCQDVFSNTKIWTNDTKIYILLKNGKKKCITTETDLNKLITEVENDKDEDLEGYRTRSKSIKKKPLSQK